LRRLENGTANINASKAISAALGHTSTLIVISLIVTQLFERHFLNGIIEANTHVITQTDDINEIQTGVRFVHSKLGRHYCVVFTNSLCITLPMAPKEPTRAQLSSRLSYSQHTPAFLRRLQNKYSGNRSYDDDEEDEEQGRYKDDPEFEDFDRGSGRPPIPRRPSIPERPPDDPGSADEDDEDEKPQIVVLKEGKHLTEREAENIRRKG